MAEQYEKDFQIGRMISISQMVTVCVIIGLTELMIAGRIGMEGTVSPMGENFFLIQMIFYFISALFLLFAFLLKRAIRTLQPGPVLQILKGMTKMVHRGTENNSALILMVPPFALCEMAVLLGFVLFILSTGDRQDFYPLYLAGLLMMVYIFPGSEEKENLAKLDRELEEKLP